MSCANGEWISFLDADDYLIESRLSVLTVGKLCTQCISFFLLPLYTAILSTEEYGTFDLLVTYSTLLLPLVNWQLDQGLFRFMLDHRGNKEEQGKLFSTLLLSSIE